MIISWPIKPGLGHLDCDGEWACAYLDFPVPDPQIPYILNCGSYRECYGSDIYCPQNADCDITCNGTQACSDVCVISHILSYNDIETSTKILYNIGEYLVSFKCNM